MHSSALAMDYARELAALKEKIKSKKSSNIDQCHREVKSELLLKRNQVSQLKKELDGANSKIFELNRLLEANRSALKETEFNLKLTLKKTSSIEAKMKEINDSYMKLTLQEEMRVSEINILNEKVQSLSRDNHQLTKDLHELNEKLQFCNVFQKDLEDKQAKINAASRKLKDDTEKLENEQTKITEFEKTLQSLEKYENLSQQLANENQKLKKVNADLENKFVETEAQYQKLASLIKSHSNTNMNNFITKIQFLQWENRCKDYEQKTLANEHLIATLTDALNQEIAANARLILKNEEYEARIQELENKVNLETDNLSKIKTENDEVIEIE